MHSGHIGEIINNDGADSPLTIKKTRWKMKTTLLIIALILVCGFFINRLLSKENKQNKLAGDPGSVYIYSAKDIEGKEHSLSEYEGKVLLIVNVASECGYTPQYKGLQALYEKYRDSGLVVIGFPCNQFGEQEPGTSAQIKEFCSVNYSVTFPIMEKIEVNGSNEHPLYTYLKSGKAGLATGDIKWNFNKFLIDRNGVPVQRYGSKSTPESIEADIERALKK